MEPIKHIYMDENDPNAPYLVLGGVDPEVVMVAPPFDEGVWTAAQLEWLMLAIPEAVAYIKQHTRRPDPPISSAPSWLLPFLPSSVVDDG